MALVPGPPFDPLELPPPPPPEPPLAWKYLPTAGGPHIYVVPPAAPPAFLQGAGTELAAPPAPAVTEYEFPLVTVINPCDTPPLPPYPPVAGNPGPA